MYAHTPRHATTSIETALRFLVSLKQRNAVVFFISDWIDNHERYAHLLKVAGCKYDFIGVRLGDACEQQFPDIGLLDVVDPETGGVATIDTRGNHNQVNRFLSAHHQEHTHLFNKHRIDLLDIPLDQPFITPLIKFFSSRVKRQI
jgi:hypothetical protein